MAQEFLGVRQPANTVRATKNGFRLFSKFVIDLVCGPSALPQYSALASFVRESNMVSSAREDDRELVLLQILPYQNKSCGMLDPACQVRLRHFLIESCTRYVSSKTKESVAPSTMLGYDRSIQRRLAELKFKVNLLSGLIFACPNEGLKAVLDNKFSEQQFGGARTKSHNILTLSEVRAIFTSEYCSVNTPIGYRNMLISALGLALGCRPNELVLINTCQFKKENVNGKPSWVFYPKIGSSKGESKNAKVGVRAVSYRTHAIPIHNISFFNGTLNIYSLIDDYFQARKEGGITSDRFFLGTKTGMKIKATEFFRDQPLGGWYMCESYKDGVHKVEY